MRGFAGGLASGLATGYQLADAAETNKLRREQLGLEIANARDLADERRITRDAERAIEEAGRSAYGQFTPPQATRDEEGQVLPGMEDADAKLNDPTEQGRRYLTAQEARIRAAYRAGRTPLIDRELERGRAIKGLIRKEEADSAVSAYQRGDLEGAALRFARLYDMVPDGKSATLASISGADTGKPVVKYKVTDRDGNESMHQFDFSPTGLQKLYYGMTDPSRLADIDNKDFDRRLKVREVEVRERNAAAAERNATSNETLRDALAAQATSRAGLADVQANAGGFRPPSGGGGGGEDWKQKVQSRGTDQNGFLFVVMKDGTTKYPTDDKGQKIKSGTTLAERLTADLTKIGARDVTVKDPAARARDVASQTGLGAAAPARAAGERPPLSSFSR